MKNIIRKLFNRKHRPTKGHSEYAIYGKGWCIVCGEFLEDK